MKKYLLAVAIAMFSLSAVAQQENPQGQPRRVDSQEAAKQRTERMQQNYNLSDEQTQSLLQLNLKYAETMPMGMRPGGQRQGPRPGAQQQGPRPQGDRGGFRNLSPEQREARIKEMQTTRQAYEKELQAILTPEQFQKYQEDNRARQQRQR